MWFSNVAITSRKAVLFVGVITVSQRKNQKEPDENALHVI